MGKINSDVRAVFVKQIHVGAPFIERTYYLLVPDAQQEALIEDFLNKHGLADRHEYTYEVTPMQIKIKRTLPLQESLTKDND